MHNQGHNNHGQTMVDHGLWAAINNAVYEAGLTMVFCMTKLQAKQMY